MHAVRRRIWPSASRRNPGGRPLPYGGSRAERGGKWRLNIWQLLLMATLILPSHSHWQYIGNR
ncbi:hypothetical protein FRX31_033596 [Thalictrum thalictroides]|uniref:Uncharacterized protein n=1 Tax=Thalictrum thalictroides TaxID=46969 RepID=A0A7J6UW45_THATH|nr:hypothetical protein FRX31_033596 [Thalictrum thalictroides]